MKTRGQKSVRTLPWFGLMLAGVVGCGGSGPSKGTPSTENVGKAATEVLLQIIKSADLERIVANYKGQVVVVDVWAEY